MVSTIRQEMTVFGPAVAPGHFFCIKDDVRLKKVKAGIAPHGNPISELYGTSLAIWDHPTQVNAPGLTLAMQAGTRVTYPGGMEG